MMSLRWSSASASIESDVFCSATQYTAPAGCPRHATVWSGYNCLASKVGHAAFNGVCVWAFFVGHHSRMWMRVGLQRMWRQQQRGVWQLSRV